MVMSGEEVEDDSDMYICSDRTLGFISVAVLAGMVAGTGIVYLCARQEELGQLPQLIYGKYTGESYLRIFPEKDISK